MKKIILLLASFCMVGCGNMCDTSAEPAIEVSVKNEAGMLIADDVLAIVSDKDYLDTLWSGHENERLRGAYERPGNYTLTITSDLYKTYTKSNIVVLKGECNVRTREFSIILEEK